MKYNFKSGRGLLSLVKTEMDGAYYTGNKINKVDKETYFIEDGIFTTCDDSTCPHYHFTASKMKVIHKQQLVAEWIFINFGGVPLPIPLPFAFFQLNPEEDLELFHQRSVVMQLLVHTFPVSDIFGQLMIIWI